MLDLETLDWLIENKVPTSDWAAYLEAGLEEQVECPIDRFNHPVDGEDSKEFIFHWEKMGHTLTGKGLVCYFLVGLELWRVKKSGHGNLIKWVTENTSFSRFTANNRMAFTTRVLWEAGIVRYPQKPRKPDILKAVSLLNSNVELIQHLCLKVHDKEKAAPKPSRKELTNLLQLKYLTDRVISGFEEGSRLWDTWSKESKNQSIIYIKGIARDFSAFAEHFQRRN